MNNRIPIKSIEDAIKEVCVDDSFKYVDVSERDVKIDDKIANLEQDIERLKEEIERLESLVDYWSGMARINTESDDD